MTGQLRTNAWRFAAVMPTWNDGGHLLTLANRQDLGCMAHLSPKFDPPPKLFLELGVVCT